MLEFFTDPYPNELLFSALSRYHYYSGNKHYCETNYELFGSKGYINRYLDVIAKLTERLGGSYNKKDIINNYTLFPAYRLFQYDVNYNNDSFMCFQKQLFYCPECAKDDIKKYGEPYFHREHQFKGIVICPIHRVAIKPYGTKHMWENINDYNRFDITNVDFDNIQIFDEPKYDKLWQISKLIFQLFECKVERYINDVVLTYYYNKILKKKGFANSNGTINKTKLEEEVIDFYGDDILNLLDSWYKDKKIIEWIRYGFDEFIRPKSPIQHLILINFLGKNINEVINDINEDYKPFGEGPWECINAVCSHQDTAVIKKVEIIPNGEFDIPYGIFECDYCGLKYSVYLLRSNNNLLHITRNGNRYNVKEILDHGTLWYKTLKNYILNNKYSITEISMRMKCDKFDVVRHAKKLNIESYLYRRNKIDKETVDGYKQQFIELINSTPNISETEILNILHNKYVFLKKYENEWLKKNFPVNLKKQIYEKKDRKTLDDYKEECLGIINSTSNLSRSDIARMLGYKYQMILKNDRIWWEKNAPPLKVKDKLFMEFDENILEVYKQEIIKLVNENPNITRTELKLNLRNKYSYILKYDKDWINIIVPRRKFYY